MEWCVWAERHCVRPVAQGFHNAQFTVGWGLGLERESALERRGASGRCARQRQDTGVWYNPQSWSERQTKSCISIVYTHVHVYMHIYIHVYYSKL